MGNLLSVSRAFEKIGASVGLVHTPEQISCAKRLVLPGVGAFAKGMLALKELNVIEAIQDYANSNRPLLGICLGMQLMLETGEENGIHDGLKIIAGRAVKIDSTDIYGIEQKVPIIGWYELTNYNTNNAILKNTPTQTRMYFVHSYMASGINDCHKLAEIKYGGRNIIASIGKGNIIGVQFHPEKSGEAGLRLLQNFIRL